MVDKRGQFLALAIVTDADDWSLCLFNNFDKSSNSTSVTLTHTVNFVHDDDAFLSGKTTDSCCKRVCVLLCLFNTNGAEVIEGLI